MKLKNNHYDILKWVALIAVPAIALFVQTLAPAYGFDPTVIVTTLNAIGVLIGALIGLSADTIRKEKDDDTNV